MSATTKVRPFLVRDKCRHFTGIQNDTCAAGVTYSSVRDASKPGPYRWPCLDVGSDLVDTCPSRSLLTQEEHAEEARQIEAAVAAMLAADAAGKCHVCGKDAEPSEVVGRCRYAACGHRVGQVAESESP